MHTVLSCHPDCYGRGGAWAAIERAGEVGLASIELPIRTAGVPSCFGDEPLVTTESSPAELRNVERLLERHGVGVSCCSVETGNPLDPAVAETIRRKIDLAAHFGVPVVLGDAGEAETDDERDALAGHLRDIGDHAARRGVVFCLATGPGLCVDHYGMRETMERIDHPHVKLGFGTADILYYNEFLEGEVALAKVCHHVRHVRLGDSQGEFGRWHFPALGYGGAVDFVRVLQLMRTCGFAGPYVVTIRGIAGEGELSPEQQHQRVADSVRHLRNCGYFD